MDVGRNQKMLLMDSRQHLVKRAVLPVVMCGSVSPGVLLYGLGGAGAEVRLD